jgi:hypothetical protein
MKFNVKFTRDGFSDTYDVCLKPPDDPAMIAAVNHVIAKLQHALAVCREYDRLYDKQPAIKVLPIPKKYSRKPR